MKFLVAITMLFAVASAAFLKPTVVAEELAQVQEIVDAINSPSTNPATAALLEQLLLDTLGLAKPEPIAVGPAVVDFHPIAVGPALIDFPLPDGGAVSAPVAPASPAVVAPAPAVVAPAQVAADTTPLVQIILNFISNAAVGEAPVAVITPEAAVDAEAAVDPVSVVDSAPVSVVDSAPVSVVDSAPVLPEAVVIAPTPVIVAPEPVQVAEPVLPEIIMPEPVIIGEPSLPVAVLPEPVIVGEPALPAPAVVLPEALN